MRTRLARSNQGAISRQKQFVLSRVILLKATARNYIRVFYITDNKTILF